MTQANKMINKTYLAATAFGLHANKFCFAVRFAMPSSAWGKKA
jgi:hypothetical protein